MLKVLVIAGTDQAKQLIHTLSEMDTELAVAVTAKLGSGWLKQYSGVSVLEGRLTLGTIIGFIEEMGTGCLIDASMPGAKDISFNAAAACAKKGIPYIQCEGSDGTYGNNEVILAANFEEAETILDKIGGNILLTAGMGKMDTFCAVPGYKNRLFALVYPESSVIARCEKLGLDAGHIIAIKGPFTTEFFIEILKHCSASVIIAKDYGNAALNLEKAKAAKELGIPMVVVKTQKPEYGRSAVGMQEVIDYVKELRKKIV